MPALLKKASIALFTLLMIGRAPMANAENRADIPGVWKTDTKNGSWGYVLFDKCGTSYCGKLVNGGGKNVDPSLFGTLIVKGVTREGNAYVDGQIFDAEANIRYVSKMALQSPDRLKVSGCVLGGLICGGQTWQGQ